MTLKRFLEKGQKGYDLTRATHRVFLSEDEESLANHIKALDSCFHGLDREKCRILAFDYAKANNINTPPNWTKDGMAGLDWFSGFMQRNKLSIRKPEATSLARQTAFNKVTVATFFDKLSDIMSRFKFAPQDIYNLDETGITTVQVSGKVVSTTGKKQVGSTSSRERGELITMCCAISASGSHIPPFYIFLRVFMKQDFMNGCAPGAKGVADRTGYMNTELFAYEYLPFFISNVRCSKDKPVLLVLDNHCSHVSLQAINVCRNSGIHLLTLPPHTSHKLQPLDRCVFGNGDGNGRLDEI
ncbi:uncharacterized protein [Watersipora subatra]|uniref:uncharacterized protein n=1 Tax=Watersipora subatra TaxID=2589382 RepID=UPI00355BEB13